MMIELKDECIPRLLLLEPTYLETFLELRHLHQRLGTSPSFSILNFPWSRDVPVLLPSWYKQWNSKTASWDGSSFHRHPNISSLLPRFVTRHQGLLRCLSLLLLLLLRLLRLLRLLFSSQHSPSIHPSIHSHTLIKHNLLHSSTHHQDQLCFHPGIVYRLQKHA